MLKFERKLEQLNEKMLEMSAEIEDIISATTQALINQNREQAYEVIAIERNIDNLERDIQALCMKLLLLQQPVAGDLRTISSALKMITDMERIGDQAEDIAELIILLSDEPYIQKLVHIPYMAEAVIKMVNDSVAAFVKKDIKLAKEVIGYDDVVDELFCKVKGELTDLILKDKNNATQALDLFMVAKYFERIGDHAVNIADWVVFSITGEHRNQRIV